ncbi:S-acyltransferase 23 [Cinnamomum micranthum f. kanehirae]|uniref:S-acyltransferase n=1 Tax=Cinnamomum micranthum f. kanehirae TaxID=337451 RepID=A0A443N6A0_9MAGN|nr:S-acyltransferase 23 [Cinnamomum micranthum f. kanehirae]
MASPDSEIEVVTDSQNHQNSNSLNGFPAEDIIVDVYSASAYGSLPKLRKFVEVDGFPLSKPDGNGYYALQWAALNNYSDITQYIIERGGEVNAIDNSQQTALHWAAVRGSVAAADVLLQNGARIEVADVNGYRAVHFAAQYGQTGFLNHIVTRYGADFDAPDNDGRSPLHWAAYKGFADTVRLLLFRDADQRRQDKDGCTPVHWAAISGNVEACMVLVQAGTKQGLLVKDNAGFTPVQLASDKGHRHIAFFLSNAQRTHGNSGEDKVFIGKIGNIGYAPILLFIMIAEMVLFMNSVLAANNFAKVTAVVGLWGWTAVSLAVVTLLMFYRCSSKDPGYIKKSLGRADVDDPLLNIDLNSSSIWTGNWSQLCPTCKIIRPMRSKHCPSCKHCVEQFDHHCPWISNCVGKKNKWDFFVFICLATLTATIAAAVAVQRMWTESPALPSAGKWIHFMVTEHPGIILFLVMDVICLSGAVALTIAQASQIARNITTNELANASRYGYLRGPEGKFRNPYNHGCRKNCTDFLIHGYSNDDEIAWPSLQQATN